MVHVTSPRPPLEVVVSQIQDRLDRLPATADAIAEFLANYGATGRRNSAFNCALGAWLGANLHTGYLLRIDDTMAAVIDAVRQGRAGAEMHVFPLLANVTTFVRGFDRGHYPDLVSEPLTVPLAA